MANKEYRKAYYQKNKVRMDAQMRAWREANPERVKAIQISWKQDHEGHTYLEKDSGYVRYIGYKHPASNASGITSLQRIVLWDKLHGRGSMCHWGCGLWVSWGKVFSKDADAIVADHVNLDKQDNSPENIVPSCQHCNLTRANGRMIGKYPQGENCKSAKLTNEQAIEIKNRLIAGENEESITNDYPIDLASVRSIHMNKAWKTTGPSMAGVYTLHFKHMDKQNKVEVVARIKSGETICYIAEDMGYHSTAVSRTFARETGMTVKEYKRLFNEGKIA